MVLTGWEKLGTFGILERSSWDTNATVKENNLAHKTRMLYVTYWSVQGKLSQYIILNIKFWSAIKRNTLNFCLITRYATRNWMKRFLKEFPFCVAILELKRSFGSDSYLLFDKRKLIVTSIFSILVLWLMHKEKQCLDGSMFCLSRERIISWLYKKQTLRSSSS